ncbi:MAG TPA: MobA/MobL family protein [Vicinamibacterales bacterium]|nr:MobA/MobL family protein [Vicinamibacterales bacterium]
MADSEQASMEWFQRSDRVPNGSRAGGGGCYHLSFRSGSRSGGACAGAAHAYITRSEQYDDPERDAAVYTESDHMPAWAENAEAAYWDAADLYERANGRLYISADFALPRELDSDDQIALAHTFAQDLTADEQLPYTLAIHAGRDADGREHNPHAHIMISERQNDGIGRPREQWFRRANSTDPGRGGAPKSRTFHGHEWMENARERWASLVNGKLRECGRAERVDHRSYERQGVDREPGRHYGPAAAHMASRGVDHERLSVALAAAERRDAALASGRNAETAEEGGRGGGRGAMSHDGDEEQKRSRDRDWNDPERLHDTFPER